MWPRILAALLLGILSAAGTAAVVPYYARFVPLPAGLPLTDVMAGAAALGLVVFAAAAFVGLTLAPRIGVVAFPALAGEAADGESDRARVVRALGVGIAAGLFAALADRFLFAPGLPAAIVEVAARMPLAPRLFAGLVFGGLNEEVLMRLFLVTLVVWALSLPARGRGIAAPAWCWWTAITLVALVFALLHLPLVHALAPLTTASVLRTLVLNTGLGVVFGVQYRRRGLEGAVLAHAGAYVALQAARHLL